MRTNLMMMMKVFLSIKCASFVLFNLLPFWSYHTDFDIKQIALYTHSAHCAHTLLTVHTLCTHCVDQKLYVVRIEDTATESRAIAFERKWGHARLTPLLRPLSASPLPQHDDDEIDNDDDDEVLPIQQCRSQREPRTTHRTCCKRGFAPEDYNISIKLILFSIIII